MIKVINPTADLKTGPVRTASRSKRLIAVILCSGVQLLIVGVVLYLTVFRNQSSGGSMTATESYPTVPILATNRSSAPSDGTTTEASTDRPEPTKPPVDEMFMKLQEYYSGKMEATCGLRDPYWQPHPWFVGIYRNAAQIFGRAPGELPSGGHYYVCSGALVARDWILTTAACGNIIQDPFLENSPFWVVAGHKTATEESIAWLNSETFNPTRVREVNKTVHILNTVALVKLLESFDVPVLDDDLQVIRINTICLPPPHWWKLPQTGQDKGSFVLSGHKGFYNGKDLLTEIQFAETDFQIETGQEIIPDDRIRLKERDGQKLKQICQNGKAGAPLYSSAKLFGAADKRRFYLDGLFASVNDPKCLADPLEATFWNATAAAPSIARTWILDKT